MPQFNPIVTPQSLSQMNTVSPLYALQGDQAVQRGIQADQAGLADLLSSYQHEAGMRPLKMQEQQIANDTGLARLPGIRAESSIKQREDRMGAATFDADVKAKLAEFATKASDAELKQFETQIQQLMYSSNPQDRKRGEALWNASQHMQEVRLKHKQEMEKVGSQNANAVKLMRMQIDAGKFSKKAGAIKTLEQAIDNAKSARERHQMLVDAATQARQAGNDDLADQYEYRAERIRPQVEAELAATQPKPGGVNVGELAGVPTNPSIPVAPPKTTPTAPKKSYTIQELQQRYPNATESQIREAAKARGIEIK